MMNYPTFLKEVDRLASLCEADDLRAFVHEIACMVSEPARQQFISTLNNYYVKPSEKTADTKETSGNFEEEIDSLIKALNEIRDGDRTLESEYNEEWDEWQDEGEAYLFSDPDHILDDITAAVGALHQCLDREKYAKGAELADILSQLSVAVTGDCDEGEMELKGLVTYDLLSISIKTTIKEAVYLTCMGSQEAERAEAMLSIMDGFRDYSISLKDILETGAEEINLSSLLPLWIEALAKRSTAADQLLLEAQEMLQDKEAVLENASRYAENHPILYKNILQTGINDADPNEMLRIGLRAMKEVPIENSTRSNISLLTAKYALEAQERQTAEQCWLEAFRTSPTVENYLRLRTQSQNWEKFASEVRDIYIEKSAQISVWRRVSLPILMFFDERFDEVIREFMNVNKGIGWSSTFMKEGIALLLMLMDHGTTRGRGMSEMLNKATSACSFQSNSFCMGTDLKPDTSSTATFNTCFETWKNNVVLPENVSESWLEMIDKWIALRISAIMEANRRSYYDECAAFIAAYGEVLESMGKPGEKERIMQQYKEKYWRRRSFLSELRSFGMGK